MKRVLAWFRRCPHDWQPTAVWYTDAAHGFTISLKQCSHCHQTIIVEA